MEGKDGGVGDVALLDFGCRAPKRTRRETLDAFCYTGTQDMDVANLMKRISRWFERTYCTRHIHRTPAKGFDTSAHVVQRCLGTR